ncbi:MAG TPA: gluconokinase [Candidatus Binataceae bacterium]|nr:gluconokinase [Candidatus Binataceae bacterium]
MAGPSIVVVLMGVSGSGKTTLGTMLARELGWEFRDGDDLHLAENKRKMHQGIALTDADRAPWLAAIRALIERFLRDDTNLIVACSALKRAYRHEIVVDAVRVKVAYLKASRELIAQRLAARSRHFFDSALLGSQFATLEEPDDAITIDVSHTPEQAVADIRAKLGI